MKEGERVNKDNQCFVLYKDWAPLVFRLTPEEKAAVFDALFRVAIGEPYEVPSSALGVFEFFLSQIEKNDEKWEETRQRRREAGKKGGEAKQSQAKLSNAKQSQAKPSKPKHNENVNENVNVNVNVSSKEDKERDKANKSPRVFVPPTLEEVEAEIQVKGHHVDALEFFNYYDSQSWKKANGQRVSNWKGCLVTWDRKNRQKEKEQAQTDAGLTDWYKIAQEVENEQRNNGSSYVDIFAGIPATVREDVGG